MSRPEVVCECEVWEDVEETIKLLLDDRPKGLNLGDHYTSDWLFRGQGNSDWELESTLQRANPGSVELYWYFKKAISSKSQIETFTDRVWADIDYEEIHKSLSNYDQLVFKLLPAYEYLVYLRHHGFPSPLLDWSRSPYVAAYFACRAPKGDRLSIYAYQEFTGFGKGNSSVTPQILKFGPNVRSHPRHFLQQCEYTMALKFIPDSWSLATYKEVQESLSHDQDRIVKISFPKSEAFKVLKILDLYNINEYSLFQTEDALLKTMAFRKFNRII